MIKLVDFVKVVFKELEISWGKFVKEDKSLLKRKFSATYCGNPAKLTSVTGWKPTTDLDHLARIMVKKELERHK
jgi:GDP-D-mannose dehydratase|tara:strand:+ start:516 stop:737 length:222 start_codon:yes stop_codon:yes gene_type:complete